MVRGPSSHTWRSREENAEMMQVYGNAENTVPNRMSSLDRAHFLDRESQNLDRVNFIDRAHVLDRESRARSRPVSYTHLTLPTIYSV